MQIQEQLFERLFTDYPRLNGCRSEIFAVFEELLSLYQRQGTLFLCGNGGSAADCDHICGELLKGFMTLRPMPETEKNRFQQLFGEEGMEIASKLQRGLRAVSLVSHPGFLTAFSNDVDPMLIFAQQLYAQSRKGDVLLGISTGGGAKNVLKAFMTAHCIGVKTILLTGSKHGICEKYADFVIAVPECETYRIQELHLPVYHALCQMLEAEIFGGQK